MDPALLRHYVGKLYARVFIVSILAVAASGCLGGNTTPPEGNNVNMIGDGYGGYSFSPSTLTIRVGENVTWTNTNSVQHNVVSDSPADPFTSGILNNGQTYTHQFNQIGTFPYHCSIHPTMTGTIVVTA